MKQILWMLIALALSPIAFAFHGGESSGGGGNGPAIEFSRIAATAAAAFTEHQVITLANGRDFDYAKFKEGAASVTLVPTREKLTLNGKAVTAINYPDRNLITFNQDEWAGLDAGAKLNLVIHELLGLKYRGVIDDSDYRTSGELAALTQTYTVEAVALAMARAGFPNGGQMTLIPERTKVKTVQDPSNPGDTQIYEVAVRTFENESADSVRVYEITMDGEGGVISARLERLEGSAGP